MSRGSGILLHITSLPSRWGIGDLGPQAFAFVDYLLRAGQRFWQVLPLGPTGWGDSPYMCFSAFALNPLLISPDLLIAAGWLDPQDPEPLPQWSEIQQQSPHQVDYGLVIPFKNLLLEQAWNRFQEQASPEDRQRFEGFCQQTEWLDDYALFMALKFSHQGRDWLTWPKPLALRDPEAIAAASTTLAAAITQQQFYQFLLADQWQALQTYANQRGIQMIGDLPIYVARDSADVWANRELFQLDPEGRPLKVAGVPPDYFSKTGQLWGNPLYNWEVMQQTGYTWYLSRIRQELQRFDYIRIDHFRGFAGYYAIPGEAPTAEQGEWVEGPGSDLFNVIQSELGELPILAEDLGLITPDVLALRDQFKLRGMKVLQFGFDGGALTSMMPGEAESQILSPSNPFLPCNYDRNYVVYTGTHDNDTLMGWLNSPDRPAADLSTLQRYLYPGTDQTLHHDRIHWDLIQVALASVADIAIIPLQDLLGLGSEARMNRPGTSAGNWSWRCDQTQWDLAAADRLASLTVTYARLSEADRVQRRQWLDPQ